MKKSLVFLEDLELIDSSLTDQFTRSFASISLTNDFDKASAVFIKPNLTYPTHSDGVTTRREFIECLVAALRKINQTTKIYIGEGGAGYNSFSMSQTLRDLGFYEIEKMYPNIAVVNLSDLPSRLVTVNTLRGPYTINLPTLFFDEIDFSISCPLPKIHSMTKISLSYKNQWGCLPDVMRLRHHYMFDFIISKVSDVMKFKYAFLDGRFGLNNSGPMLGDPVETNWFVAANSLGVFDIVVADLMGISWQEIRHLSVAKQYGYIPEKGDIEIDGSLDHLRKEFVLKRKFWDLPALTAFRSRRLTHFFYLSKASKLLHDIMYLFREREC